jgi:hypothetical protein
MYVQLLASLRKSARAVGYDPAHFGTHSFRIGGATFLADMRVPRHLLERMGRWSAGSSSLARYTRAGDSAVRLAAGFLADSMA